MGDLLKHEGVLYIKLPVRGIDDGRCVRVL